MGAFKYTILLLVGIGLCWNRVLPQVTILQSEKIKPESVDVPQRTILKDNASVFQIEYLFSEILNSEIYLADCVFNNLIIPGFENGNQPGLPQLPSRVDLVGIPVNGYPNLEITASEYIEFNNISISPAESIHRDSEHKNDVNLKFDSTVYCTDDFYPNEIVKLSDIQYVKGTPLALIQITPIQYNPVKNKVRVYYKVQYEIKNVFTGKSKSTEISSSSFNEGSTKYLSNLVINNIKNSVSQKHIKSVVQKSDVKTGFDYLIVTHNEFFVAAEKLALWKQQLGYQVKIISKEFWSSNQVKDSIHYYYHNFNQKPEYFVIIGDHTGNYAVPGETLNEIINNKPFVSDLYYACIDGADDYMPDMAHGRIPVKTREQALQIIQKIIQYEKEPTSDSAFYKNALACSYFQDDNDNSYADRRFCHTSEEIRDYLMVNEQFNIDRIYTTNSSNPLFYNNTIYSNGTALPDELLISNGFNWSGGETQIINSLNKGKFLVLQRGHGYSNGDGWIHPTFKKSSIDLLANSDKMPVVFSINCNSGDFSVDNCFAERILNSGNGAAGVVAASCFSYSGYNDGFLEGMVDAIWPNPGLLPDFGIGGAKGVTVQPKESVFTMGNVLNLGLARMMQTWTGNSKYTRYQFEIFQYFGDPAMKLWTAQPQSLKADYDSVIPCGSKSIEITNANCDAVATAVYKNKLIGKTTLSDGYGVILFNEPVSNDFSELIITISNHNYKPHIDTVKVSEDCNVAPVSNFEIDNTIGCTESIFTFKANNYFKAKEYEWKFSTDKIEFLENTSFIDSVVKVRFLNIGEYDVTLIVKNKFGIDTLTNKNQIQVRPVLADFSFNTSNYVVGSEISANVVLNCNVETTSWKIIQNSGYKVLSENNTDSFSFKFFKSGNYDIQLAVENTLGADTIVRSIYVSDIVSIQSDSSFISEVPIKSGVNYSYSQTIYSNEHIGIPCIIREMAFNWNCVKEATDTIRVYMGHSSKSEFYHEKDWVTHDNLVLVYDGPLTANLNSAWTNFTLDKSFNYNGFHNLVIAIEKPYNGNNFQNGNFICSSDYKKNRSLTYSGSNYGMYKSAKISGDLSTSFPNIQFAIEASNSSDFIFEDLNEETLCFGDSVEINGNYYSSENILFDTLHVESGTQMFLPIAITVLPVKDKLFEEVFFCTGESVAVNGSEINNEGIYNYFVKHDDYCIETTVSVIENPLPEIQLGNDTILEFNSGTELIACNYSSCVWSTGDIGRSIQINESFQVGTYSIGVEVTNEFNCTSYDTIAIKIIHSENPLLGKNGNLNIQIYPNPATEHLVISNHSVSDITEVNLISFNGQEVYSKLEPIRAGMNEEIILFNIPNGVYYLNVYQDDIVKTFKILKTD